MDQSIYNRVYIIMNLFNTYIIFKFMCVFFVRKAINKHKESLSYMIYFVFITAVYLLINIPVVMLACNLIGFTFLSYNYRSGIKQRILSVLYIYIILLCIESIVVIFTGHLNSPLFSKNSYSSILGIIIIKITSFMVVLFIQNYKNVKKGNIVPTTYWFSLVLIPSASIYIIVILFYATGLTISHILSCIILLLIINVTSFYLYDSITLVMEDKMAKMILIQQNEYYERQFQIMKTAQEATKSVRHDLINHLSILQSFVKNSESAKLHVYLSDLIKTCDITKEYAHSENVIIDSILNFKLQEADQKNIEAKLELNIPEQLSFSTFDMTVILGNLFDNAINASLKLEVDKRRINIGIKYDKGRLIINIKNNYKGNIIYVGDNIVTSNTDKKNHGIGFINVKNTVEKYQGLLEVKHTEEVFCITVLLFL